METGPSSLIYSVIDIAQGVAAIALLIAVIWIWRKGPRWARILIVIAIIAAAIAALLLGLYIYALGQANWSL